MRRVFGWLASAATFAFGILGDALHLLNPFESSERLDDEIESGQDSGLERPEDSCGYRVTHPPDDRQ